MRALSLCWRALHCARMNKIRTLFGPAVGFQGCRIDLPGFNLLALYLLAGAWRFFRSAVVRRQS